MKEYPLLPIAIISLVVIVCVSLYFNTISNKLWISQSNPAKENIIKSTLPEGIMLRDFQQIPNLQEKYLIIYIEKGYKSNSWDLSCPGIILADSIIGVYHLALIQDNKIINDLTIPQAYLSDYKLELTYKNYKDGWPIEGEKKEKEIIKLIDFKDLTGDGLYYEFILTTTGGGCGFYDSLVGAYDPEQNRAVLYSDWLPRFKPDSNGRSKYLFECGDHGNMTKEEMEYQFSQTSKTYEILWEKDTPCK